jgi:hypothetical protein
MQHTVDISDEAKENIRIHNEITTLEQRYAKLFELRTLYRSNKITPDKLQDRITYLIISDIIRDNFNQSPGYKKHLKFHNEEYDPEIGMEHIEEIMKRLEFYIGIEELPAYLMSMIKQAHSEFQVNHMLFIIINNFDEYDDALKLWRNLRVNILKNLQNNEEYLDAFNNKRYDSMKWSKLFSGNLREEI